MTNKSEVLDQLIVSEKNSCDTRWRKTCIRLDEKTGYPS